MNSVSEPRQLFGYDQEHDLLWVAMPNMGPQARLRIPGAWLRAKMPSRPELATRFALIFSISVFMVLLLLIVWQTPSIQDAYLIGLGSLAGAYAEKIGNALAKIWRERRRKENR